MLSPVASATIAASRQLGAEASAIKIPLAATNPTVSGTSPACTMRRHGRSLKRRRGAHHQQRNDGRRPELGDRRNQQPRPAGDVPTDQRYDHHVRPRRGLRHGEQRAEFWALIH